MLLRLWVTVESRLRGESGASLVEYALLVALIAIAAIVAINIVGDQLDTSFRDIAEELENPGGGGGGSTPPASTPPSS